MTPCPRSLDVSSSFEEALDTMSLGGFRHLPVTESGEVVGILTRRELGISKALCDRVGDCPASLADIKVTQPLVIRAGDEVSTVARLMAEKKEDCALVSDEDGNFVGIFTTSDACTLLHLVLEESRSKS
jgi:CBS domain-containing protein